MDKQRHYTTLIQSIFSQLAESYSEPDTDISTELSFDQSHGNYILLEIGWTIEERIKRIIAYVRLRNDKVWVETDWTEEGLASYLLDAGVPNQDIVLAFNPPHMRQYTEFAVA